MAKDKKLGKEQSIGEEFLNPDEEMKRAVTTTQTKWKYQNKKKA